MGTGTFYAKTYDIDINQRKNRMNKTVSARTAALNSQGLIMLHRNNNYSNTMRPCVYICKRNKIHWM